MPAEVELEGIDMAEFGQDFFPEFERAPEIIVEPDGREVEAAPILLEAYRQTNGGHEVGAGRRSTMFDASRTTNGARTVTRLLDVRRANSTGTYILTVLGLILMVGR